MTHLTLTTLRAALESLEKVWPADSLSINHLDMAKDDLRTLIAELEKAEPHSWRENYQHFLSYSSLIDSPELKMAYEHGSEKTLRSSVVKITDAQRKALQCTNEVEISGIHPAQLVTSADRTPLTEAQSKQRME